MRKLCSLFPSKLGAFDDVEVVMSVYCRPGFIQSKRSSKASPFKFDPCERFFLWNLRSRQQRMTAG